MMRSLTISFKKIFTSSGFYLCIAMTLVLLFTAEVYFDFNTQNRYSVIRVLTDFSSEEIAKHYEFYDLIIMNKARGGWLTLFVPIIASFCFVPQMCAESDGNAVRFQIFRTSKNKYYISRFFSGVISGGLALAIGYAVFCAAVCFLFPSASQLNANEMEMYAGSFRFSEALLSMFFYGIFWSVPAMFCTSVLKNKYLIMCIPFFIKYGLSQTVQKLTQNAVADFFNIDEDMLRFSQIADPDALLWFFNRAERLPISVLYGVTAAAFFVGYLIVKQHWSDSGA